MTVKRLEPINTDLIERAIQKHSMGQDLVYEVWPVAAPVMAQLPNGEQMPTDMSVPGVQIVIGTRGIILGTYVWFFLLLAHNFTEADLDRSSALPRAMASLRDQKAAQAAVIERTEGATDA